MNVNPYLVFQVALDNPQKLQDKLNELYNTGGGYELVAIWQGPGSFVTGVMIMKNVLKDRPATLRDTMVASGT